MNLSKAYDTLNRDLSLAKLKSYGFSENAIKLLWSYLKDLQQAFQIKNNKFSSCKKAQAGVP